ncbi:chitin deacetylase [Phlyctochytrium bullatum]|nr:chitin deacetylase [Phlyctochytrium bullatum]
MKVTHILQLLLSLQLFAAGAIAQDPDSVPYRRCPSNPDYPDCVRTGEYGKRHASVLSRQKAATAMTGAIFLETGWEGGTRGRAKGITSPPAVPNWTAFVFSNELPEHPISRGPPAPAPGTPQGPGGPSRSGIPWGDPRHQASEFGACVQGTWAFTYDDGPSENTDRILAQLEKAGVKATFFVIGSSVVNNANNAAALKRAFDAGHEIGIHTWSHQHTSTLPTDLIISEIIMTAVAIYKVIGRVPRYFRPPCKLLLDPIFSILNRVAKSNPVGDMDDRMRNILAALGMRAVVWTVDTNDYGVFLDDVVPTGEPQLIRRQATLPTSPLPDGDGSVTPIPPSSTPSEISTANPPTSSSAPPPPPPSTSSSSSVPRSDTPTSAPPITSDSTSATLSSTTTATNTTSRLLPTWATDGRFRVVNATSRVRTILDNGGTPYDYVRLSPADRAAGRTTSGYISLQHDIEPKSVVVNSYVLPMVLRNGDRGGRAFRAARGVTECEGLPESRAYLAPDDPFARLVANVSLPLRLRDLVGPTRATVSGTTIEITVDAGTATKASPTFTMTPPASSGSGNAASSPASNGAAGDAGSSPAPSVSTGLIAGLAGGAAAVLAAVAVVVVLLNKRKRLAAAGDVGKDVEGGATDLKPGVAPVVAAATAAAVVAADAKSEAVAEPVPPAEAASAPAEAAPAAAAVVPIAANPFAEAEPAPAVEAAPPVEAEADPAEPAAEPLELAANPFAESANADDELRSPSPVIDEQNDKA